MTLISRSAQTRGEVAVLARMMANGTGRQATSDNMPGESRKAEHAIGATAPTPAAVTRGYERQAVLSTNIPRKPQEGVAVTSKRDVVESVLDDDDLLAEGSGHSPNEEEALAKTVGTHT